MSAYLRTATTEDCTVLLELWERSARSTHDFLDEAAIAGLRPQVEEVLKNDALGWWVLDSPTDGVIGFLGYLSDSVQALFIDPKHQRRGAGRALMAHAEQLSTGNGLTVDVNEANVEATRFYEALGFVAVGRSPTDSDGRPYPILHLKRGPMPR